MPALSAKQEAFLQLLATLGETYVSVQATQGYFRTANELRLMGLVSRTDEHNYGDTFVITPAGLAYLYQDSPMIDQPQPQPQHIAELDELTPCQTYCQHYINGVMNAELPVFGPSTQRHYIKEFRSYLVEGEGGKVLADNEVSSGIVLAIMTTGETLHVIKLTEKTL